MPKNIEPKLQSIGTYLSLAKGSRFVIPNYQRAYSWNIEQCDKLWQDIENFIESNGADPYFFGTIIIDYTNDKEPNLIDGQQRTTTFVLLLKALLIQIADLIDNISNDRESESLKDGLKDKRDKILSILYHVDAEERAELIGNPERMKDNSIIENLSINETYKNEIKAIVGAKDYSDAESCVHKTPRKQKDNKYTNYFKNFKFFYEKLNSKGEANINLFAKVILEKCEIIEIRSWQIEQAITMFNSLNSTGLPLSSSDIISAQLYSKSDDRAEFNRMWETIVKSSKELEELIGIGVDHILTQYMYFLRAKNNEYKDNEVTMPGLRRYFIDVKKELLNNPSEFAENMDCLIQIWDKIKDYPIVKLLLKFNENNKLFVASFLKRYKPNEIDEDKVNAICICMLRLFTVLELIEAGYSSSNFKTFLFNINKKLVNTKIDVAEIEAEFTDHIRKNWAPEDINDRLLDYKKNVLVYLDEFLFSTYKKKSFSFDKGTNVEHIMPASGKNISTIREDAGLSEDEFDDIVDKLGNKILLEENINKSIGNEWFKTKKQKSIKDKSGYKDSKFAKAEELVYYKKDKWENEDIVKATEQASKRITDFIFN